MESPGYYSQPITTIDESATINQLIKQTKNQQPTTPRRNISNPRPRYPISEKHLAIGVIVFLQQKFACQKNCSCVLPDCQRPQLDAKGYNHPAVVLDIRDDRSNGGELTALCCTVCQPRPNSTSAQNSIFGRSQQTHNRTQKKGPATLPLPISQKEKGITNHRPKRSNRSLPRT